MDEQQSGAAPGRRTRRDAQENRRQILAVAKQLFDTQGVDRTSMREIAIAAGVGQGTLYRHFAHKGDLCHALIKKDIAAFEERVGADLRDTGRSALARLEILLLERIQITESHLPLFPVMEERHREARHGRPGRTPFEEWTRARIVELLAEAATQREVRPLDTEFTADAILAVLSPRVYIYQRQQGGYSVERISAGLRGLFVEGLRLHSAGSHVSAARVCL